MANSDDRFDSGSSNPRRRAGLSTLESDAVVMAPSHRSHTENNNQGITHGELALGGVIPLNVDSRTQPCDDIGDIGQRFESFCLTHRTQQSSDSTVQSLGVPGLCGSLQQQLNYIDDTLNQVRCPICFVRWLNLVVKTCRHLTCDVCCSKGSSHCVICRGHISGMFPIRLHSAHMVEDIDIPIASQDQLDMTEILMGMGFQRADIRRAIRHTTDEPNTTSKLNSIIEYLAPSDGSDKTHPILESAYSIPTPEELESILKDPKANREDKTRLVDWLQVTTKCLICKVKSPCICLLPCYHLAICLECHEDTQKRPQTCPDSHCGKKVNNQVKIHL